MRLLGPLLLGSGHLGEDVRSQLDVEGVLLLAEGLPGSIALHHRANGRRAGVAFRATNGAIAITRQRLVVWSEGRTQIDLPLRDRRLQAIEVATDRDDRVLFAFELERLQADRSGRIEIRLRTTQAAQIVALVEAMK
jgi:hypothetical protein